MLRPRIFKAEGFLIKAAGSAEQSPLSPTVEEGNVSDSSTLSSIILTRDFQLSISTAEPRVSAHYHPLYSCHVSFISPRTALGTDHTCVVLDSILILSESLLISFCSLLTYVTRRVIVHPHLAWQTTSATCPAGEGEVEGFLNAESMYVCVLGECCMDELYISCCHVSGLLQQWCRTMGMWWDYWSWAHFTVSHRLHKELMGRLIDAGSLHDTMTPAV